MAAKVPVYRERQVNVNAAPNVRQQIDTPAAAFGTLNAQALENAGIQAQKIGELKDKRALAMQEERNKAKVMEAEKALMDWQVDYLHNPEAGAYMRRGGNALNVTRDTVQAYDERLKKILADKGLIENDEQARLFNNKTLDIQNRLFEQVSKFERDELYQYGNASRNALLESYRMGAAASAQNPNIAEGYYGQMREIMAEDPNIPPEQVDNLIAIERSKNALTAINSLYDEGRYAEAGIFFSSYEKELTGPDYERARLVAEKAKRVDETNTVAEQILVQSGTLAEAIQNARAYEDKEGKEWTDELVTRIKQKDGERKLMVDKDRSEAVRNAWQAIDGGSGPEVIPVWAERSMKQAMQKAISDRAAGVYVQTDQPTFYKLKREYLDNPGGFATKDISQYMNKLGSTDRQLVMQWQAEAAAGISDSQMKSIKQQQLNAGQIDDEGKAVMRQALGESWMKNTKNSVKRNAFLYKLEVEVEREAERQKKDGLNRDEVRGIAQRLITEGRVSDGRWWWRDEKKRGYQVEETERDKFYVPYGNIPEPEIQKIRRAIEQNNKLMAKSGQRDRIIPLTREGVERVYNAQQQGLSLYEPGITEQ